MSAQRKAGLIVRSGPFRGRSSRDQLDVALAAASMDCDLELFFSGEGILQLMTERSPASAGLPAGIRGWKALPGLCEVNAFSTDQTMSDHVPGGVALLLDVKTVTGAEAARRLSGCDTVLVI